MRLIVRSIAISSTLVRLTVLLKPEEAARLNAYCDESGRKKSTLVARLIRDHLDKAQTGNTGQATRMPTEER